MPDGPCPAPSHPPPPDTPLALYARCAEAATEAPEAGPGAAPLAGGWASEGS